MLVGNGSYLLAVDKNQLKAHAVGPSSGFFFVNFLYRARGGRRFKLSKSAKADFQWPFLACWLMSFRKKEDGKECVRFSEDSSKLWGKSRHQPGLWKCKWSRREGDGVEVRVGVRGVGLAG